MNEVALSDGENIELEKLINEAHRNAPVTQKYATEAAKMLSVTKERLADYKDRGFFKRCWYAVSGKTEEIERANQNDLIKMQKFAWCYLAKLQEQNLIQAKAIAVVRNNLKELQDEVGELSEQISAIVDKFDARLTDWEGTTALLDWLSHIKLNDRIVKGSKYICFLQIVYDCISVMRKQHIGFEKANLRKDIDAALLEFGIDRYEEMTVDAFISGLYGEINGQGKGIQVLKSIIDIDLDGKPMPATYITDNFAGTGCTALYAFEREMANHETAANLIPDERLRNEVRLGAVRAVTTNGNARYTLSELGREIVGACLMAEDLYRAENDIVVADKFDGSGGNIVGEFDIGDLLDDCVQLDQHAFLADSPTKDECHSYIESFALIFAMTGGFRNSEYHSAVARLFGCPESEDAVKSLVEALRINSQSVNIHQYLRVVNTNVRRYAWALDAMMIGCVDGVVATKVKNGIKTVMCKAFGLQERDVAPFLDNAEVLVSKTCAEDIKSSIAVVSGRTENWAPLLKFRGIVINGEIDANTAVVSDDDGKAEIVGLSLEPVPKVPFLSQQVEQIVSLDSKWFVLCDDGRLWKSVDGQGWEEVALPKKLQGQVWLKCENNVLIVWTRDVFHGEYHYSDDGEVWSSVPFKDMPAIKPFGWLDGCKDFFYYNGKWYYHWKSEESFTYSWFVFDKTGVKIVSKLYMADSLAGPWTECTSLGIDTINGFEIGSSCLFGFQDGIVAACKMSDGYKKALDIEYDRVKVVFARNGKRWERARLDSELSRIGNQEHGAVGFCPVDDGVVFCGEFGVFYSMGCLSWRKVCDVSMNGPLQKVGRYYCGFGARSSYESREGKLFFTSDGLHYKELPITQRPCKTCFKGDQLLLVDQNDKDGGLFVGRLEVKNY